MHRPTAAKGGAAYSSNHRRVVLLHRGLLLNLVRRCYFPPLPFSLPPFLPHSLAPSLTPYQRSVVVVGGEGLHMFRIRFRPLRIHVYFRRCFVADKIADVRFFGRYRSAGVIETEGVDCSLVLRKLGRRRGEEETEEKNETNKQTNKRSSPV
eukprot:GHVU01094774.1.p1 GENE.GHVU01094774.1~~GHVU01094774.1.p1  ORF type:complete len:152 (-),score=13.76 GHVU01094774.1:197-652(-)